MDFNIAAYCINDCGCAGGQPAATCVFLPSCTECRYADITISAPTDLNDTGDNTYEQYLADKEADQHYKMDAYIDQQWRNQATLSTFLISTNALREARAKTIQGYVAWKWLRFTLRPRHTFATTRWFQLEALRYTKGE